MYYNIGVALVAKEAIKPEPTIKQRSEKISRCSNPDCKKHKQNKNYPDFKFCPTCGSPTESFVKEWEEKIEADFNIRDIFIENDIDEDEFFILYDDLHNLGKDAVLFISNEGDESHKVYGGYDDNTDNWKITPEIIPSAINSFKKRYAKPIELIEKNFKSIEIFFGVVPYIL